MKKKIFALVTVLMLLVCSMAAAEIKVTKRDLGLNTTLDKNVNHILLLLQDGGKTDTLMLASINSRTGRSVMTCIDPDLVVNVPEKGDVPLSDVYELGDKKSRGLLAARTVNSLFDLNVSTYVALDMELLPEMVEVVGALNMQLTAEEAEAMGTWEGINELTGDDVLKYVRLRLENDDPARSRGYDALMQLLYQGMHSGDLMGLMGLGTKMLSAMDSNLNVMTAMTLAGAVQAGEDRREVSLPAAEQILTEEPLTANVDAMKESLHREIYE